MKTFQKNPNEAIRYGFDWVDWLEAETIATSAWSFDVVGLTTDTETSDTTSSAIKLSGGDVGIVYTVTNTVTTNTGQIKEECFKITIRAAC